MKDFLHAIFSRGSQNQTNDPLVMVGGVDYTSASITTEVAHYSGGAQLVYNLAPAASGTATSIVSISGTPNVVVTAGTMSANVLGQARTTDPVATANGAQTPIITDSLGKQVVLPGAINDLHLDGQAAVAGIAAVALIPAVAAGRRIALQSILATCSGSQTVQVIISGGPNNRTFGYAFPGGGFALNAGGAALYITSASTALSVQGDVTATFNVFATGYSLSN